MKKRYVYADEASFLRGTEEILGTGIFISKTQIEGKIITQAMQLLISDPDFDKKMDQRTFDHGYFHASEDSKNAHSHLCRCIVENVSGNFVYSYLSKNGQPGRPDESLYRLTLKLVFSKFMNEPCEVDLIMEERMGFSQYVVSRFLKEYYQEYARIAGNLPSIINIFPKISISVSGKSQPGLQVVDFILWAMNRSMMIPKLNTWRERLKLKLSESMRSENGQQVSGNYFINKPVLEYAELTNTRINYPFNLPENIPIVDAHITNYYHYIELFLTHISLGQLPDHCLHLQGGVIKSQEVISGKEAFNEKSLQLICYTFIYLFDTLPVYRDFKEEDEESWLNILFAKRLAGIAVGSGGIHHGRTRDSILRWKWAQNKMINYEHGIK
jgi:hypothetical protein